MTRKRAAPGRRSKAAFDIDAWARGFTGRVAPCRVCANPEAAQAVRRLLELRASGATQASNNALRAVLAEHFGLVISRDVLTRHMREHEQTLWQQGQVAKSKA